MFYGGVVVPVGGRILGSETEQGFITQAVTNYLNLAGAVCLAMWLEHLWNERRNGVSKIRSGGFDISSRHRWEHFSGFYLEEWTPSWTPRTSSVLNPKQFDTFHRSCIIGISSLQWLNASSVPARGLTLRRTGSGRRQGVQLAKWSEGMRCDC